MDIPIAKTKLKFKFTYLSSLAVKWTKKFLEKLIE